MSRARSLLNEFSDIHDSNLFYLGRIPSEFLPRGLPVPRSRTFFVAVRKLNRVPISTSSVTCRNVITDNHVDPKEHRRSPAIESTCQKRFDSGSRKSFLLSHYESLESSSCCCSRFHLLSRRPRRLFLSRRRSVHSFLY
jgi:hypothetical protein